VLPSYCHQAGKFFVHKTDGVAKLFRREAPSSNLFASGSVKSLLWVNSWDQRACADSVPHVHYVRYRVCTLS
jgi:hypothetical protein